MRLRIEDAPSFVHRGLMLDTARHYLPVESIKRNIQAMRVAKMNVLHIHFTDSDSFPLEIGGRPEVSLYGAFSASEVYSAQAMADLVDFAQVNGVVIIPEVDSPGHARSWSLSPQWRDTDSCLDYFPKALYFLYCYEPPCGQLDPTMEKTYELVRSVLNTSQALFRSQFVHLGGDEAINFCWMVRPSISWFMLRNRIRSYKELQSYYRMRQKQFIDLNHQAIFWVKNAKNLQIHLDKDDVIQFWGKGDSLADLKGVPNRVIFSTLDYLYFDCGNNGLQGTRSYCAYNTWQRVYQFDPLASALPRSQVLGAEACMWGELTDSNNLDGRVWPRLGALALRLWNVDERLTNKELAQRLIALSKLQKEQGSLRPYPVTTEFCEKHTEQCYGD